jgi:hypothetical protein
MSPRATPQPARDLNVCDHHCFVAASGAVGHDTVSIWLPRAARTFKPVAERRARSEDAPASDAMDPWATPQPASDSIIDTVSIVKLQRRDSSGSRADATQAASPSYSVRAEGAHHQWRKDPPGELSIVPVADERPCRVTGLVEAS